MTAFDRTSLQPLIENGWTVGETAVEKTFHFDDFNEAFGFMTRAAMWAEKWDHHPDWSNSYRTVTVRLTTHSAKGLTVKDVKLAAKMDALAAQ